MESREEHISDANICFATVKKQGQLVMSVFVYDEEKQKICTPDSYYNGKPKYLNLTQGRNGKKYIYMDTEVSFLGQMIDDKGFQNTVSYFKNKLPENAFECLFSNVIVPSVGSGVPASDLVRASRKISRCQVAKAQEKQSVEETRDL